MKHIYLIIRKVIKTKNLKYLSKRYRLNNKDYMRDVLAEVKKSKKYKRLKFQAYINIRLEILWYKIKKILRLIK